MTRSEVAKLLAKAAVLDARTVDQLTIEAWYEVVCDIDFRDGLAALTKHRRSSTDYLLPAHIVVLAAECRRERITAERLAEARERASRRALPEPELKPMPGYIREFIENFGRIPDEKPSPAASFATAGSPADTRVDEDTQPGGPTPQRRTWGPGAEAGGK